MLVQTNRTILFQKVNGQAKSIIDQIDSEKVVDDKTIKEINENFLIYSFDEFITKFSPHITVAFDLNTSEVEFYGYDSIVPHSIDMNMEEIGILGKDNFFDILYYNTGNKRILKNFNEIMDSFLKADLVEEMLDEMKSLLIALGTCPENSRSRLLMEFMKKWDDSLIIIQFLKQNAIDMSQIMYCRQKTTDDEYAYQMKIVEDRFSFETNLSRMQMKDLFENVLNQYTGTNKKLWQDSFKTIVMSYDETEISEIQNEYLNIYNLIIKKMKVVFHHYINLLLNVNSFFEVYGNLEGEMPPSLLISNMEIEDLDVQEKTKLSRFFEGCNEKNDFDNTIWYGIVSLKNGISQKTTRSRFVGHDSNERYIDDGEYKDVLNLLAQYKIQCFLSTDEIFNNEKNYIASSLIDKKSDDFTAVVTTENAKYLYPCYPNFTVLARENASYLNNGSNHTTYFEGLYIQASYVSAGLMAACQDPCFIKYFVSENVDMETPGIRVCNNKQLRYIKKKLGNRLPFINYMIDEQEGVEKYSNCTGIKYLSIRNNVEICLGHSATMGSKVYFFDEVQVMTYIERMIRMYSKDFEETSLRNFFTMRREGEFYRWQSKRINSNSILHDSDKLNYEIQDKELIIAIQFAEYENQVQMSIKRT